MMPEKPFPSLLRGALCFKRRKTPPLTDDDVTPELEGAVTRRSTDDSSSEASAPVDRRKTAVLARRQTFHGQFPMERKPVRFSRPRRSISDESTSSATSLVQVVQGTSLYQQGVEKLVRDDRWKKETALGTRIGFYRLYRDVGKGNFSKVKMGVHYLTKEKVAVKIVDKGRLPPKGRQMLNQEVSALEAVRHPNIVRLFEVVDTPSKLFLVLEFAEGGELFCRVAAGGRVPEPEAKVMFAQMASAVDHLHKNNIIHRDLKAENVFLSGKTIKIGDFGFSARVQNPKEALLTFCGSPPYAAPEIFNNENYSGPGVDLWSLGVLLYFVVTASLPFKGDTASAVKKRVLQGQFSVPKFVSRDCAEVIGGLLQVDPTKRMTAGQLKNCAWIRGMRVSVLKNDKNSTAALENEVLETLESMGISEDMIKEHKTKGARSNVMGTYNIVMHRNEEKYLSEEGEKKKYKIVFTCPTFQSKTCTIL